MSMNKHFFVGIIIVALFAVNHLFAAEVVVDNGHAIYDTSGNTIHPHGGGILQFEDYYYWFGFNSHYNENNSFFAVSCYRSKDLKHWEFRNHVLRQNSDPDLEYAKIERPKVIYNPSTDKFVMWMHKEFGSHYGEARAAVASCDTVDGDYTYHGSFQPLGHMSRDCTLYVDDDGAAYFLSAANNNADLNLYRLTADFLAPDYLVTTIWPGQWREAPCLFKRNGVYFIVSSGTTGWNPNPTLYGWATDLAGPWSGLSNLSDSSTTFASQPTYVLPIQGTGMTSYLYMGDRWAGAWGDYVNRSLHVWLPLEFPTDTTMEMPYYDALSIDVETGSITPAPLNGWQKVNDSDSSVVYTGTWDPYNLASSYQGNVHYSWTTGSLATYSFTGTKSRYYGLLRNDLGYADIYIDGVWTTNVDCYSDTTVYDALLYETPELTNGPHTLTVKVTGTYNPAAIDTNGEIVIDAFSSYVPSSGSGTADLQADTAYRIINRKSGKILTVGDSNKTADNAPLLQYTDADADYQKWLFELQPDDTFLIRSVFSDKVADVFDSALSNGASIVQNTNISVDSQQWWIADTGAGIYKIENLNSGKMMGIQDSSWDDGAQNIQYDDNGDDSQQWLLMPSQDVDRTIWIEAESASAQADFPPFTVESGGSLPEGEYIVVPFTPGAGNQPETPSSGICEYQFTTEIDANVRVRLLACSSSDDDNSFYIRLDSQPYENIDLQQHPTDFLWGYWTQRPLDAGTHTLTVAWLEDNAKLDKILIEIDPIFKADYDDSGRVDILDFRIMSNNWLQDVPAYDIAPEGGDGIINFRDFQILAEEWAP